MIVDFLLTVFLLVAVLISALSLMTGPRRLPPSAHRTGHRHPRV